MRMPATNLGDTGKPIGASALTLTELVVVVLILAVITALTAPLLIEHVEKARMAEAFAGMSAIRIRLAERSSPRDVGHGEISEILGLDFNGNAYFDNACFRVDMINSGEQGITFIVTADGAPVGHINNAPQAGDVAHIVVQMTCRGQTRYSTDKGETWSAPGHPWPG